MVTPTRDSAQRAVDGGVSLLRLHVRHDGVLLPADGHRGILLLPVVHQPHLLLHQGKTRRDKTIDGRVGPFASNLI